MAESTTANLVYRAHSRYRLFALASIVTLGLFGWSLLHRFDLGSLFFFAVCLFGALWSGANLSSQVEVDDVGVLVYTPPGRAQRVEYRQVFSVGESGRLIPAIVLLYHPLRADGLVELDEVRTCILPGVADQASLLDLLQARVPR